MAIRYAGIEFDTVKELIAYKKAMQEVIVTDKDGQEGIGISNNAIILAAKASKKPEWVSALRQPKILSVNIRKKSGRKSKATDANIIDVLSHIKKPKSMSKIVKRLGYKGNFQPSVSKKIFEVAKANNLADKIKLHPKMKYFKSEAAQPKPAKSRKNKWFTKHEDKLIQQLYSSGRTYRQIGKEIGRNARAVINRLYNLKRLSPKTHAAGTMLHKKPFVPQSYQQQCVAQANRAIITEKIGDSHYVPFPSILGDNDGVLRMIIKDLIKWHINAISIDYADNLSIKEKDWADFLLSFMQQSSSIAKHFGIEDKFVCEIGSNKIIYTGKKGKQ